MRGLSALAFAWTSALALPPSALQAQLRPLDPVDWQWLAGDDVLSLQIGVAAFSDQRASLAGTEGDLWQFGDLYAGWRTGRVVLEASGTAYRRFRDRTRFAQPHGGAEPTEDDWRSDAGDFRLTTTVQLTREGAQRLALLRFGTRLPTTDNRVGLERDRTDFYGLVGGALVRDAWWIGAETGVGINGTRDPEMEQSDVWIFLVSTGRQVGWLTGTLQLAGHADGMRDAAVRGNEELAEIRVGLRAGSRRWVSAALLTGLTDFSPGHGLQLTVGTTY